MSIYKALVKFVVAVVSLVLIFPPVVAQTVRLPGQNNEKNKLPDKLIVAALQRGGVHSIEYPYGNIEQLPLSTRINGVRNGELDVFFAMTTPEYEREFQAVYIPIYRGLMGMRLAIVKRENKDLLQGVNTLNDLYHFSAGQGRLWADSKILEHNGIPLVLELKYPNLFRMLEADRFDYFPRGIHEPWSEVSAWQNLNLVVDSHIMLHYDAPFYFFVSKNNKALVDHLTQQLMAMVDDGSFINMFYNDEDVKSALSQANVERRVVIRLENPFLTPKTPLDKKELWFTPNENRELSVSENRL